MGLLDDSSEEILSAQQQKSFIVQSRRLSAVSQLIDIICEQIPEFESRKFSEKGGNGKYAKWVTQKTPYGKLNVERCEILRLSEGKYQINIEYSAIQAGCLAVSFMLIGLLFGIIPGILIYVIFVRRDPAEALKMILPALHRFEDAVRVGVASLETNPQQWSEPKLSNPKTSPSMPTISASDDLIVKLERLKKLLDDQVVSQEQFQKMRDDIIGGR